MDRNGAKRNIEVAGTEFAARLRVLRLERRLTKVQLARLAGLAPRSITDFENGRRERVLASSVMMLARALGVKAADLVGPGVLEEAPAQPAAEPAAPGHLHPSAPVARFGGRLRRHRTLLASILLLLLLAIGGAVLREQALASARIGIEDGCLVGRDGIVGLPLWRYDGAPAEVVAWHQVPWDDERILFGLAQDRLAGGKTVLVERRTGTVVWEHVPCAQSIGRSLPEHESERNLVFGQARFLDAGSRPPEILIQYDDHLDGRSFLCFLAPDGAVVARYCHIGRITSLSVQDIDGDGRHEVLAAGQNMSACLRGASFVILDDEHRGGASRDTLCGGRPGAPDSSRVRFALPSFGEPYMSLLGWVCLEAGELHSLTNRGGETRICADVGRDPFHVIVTLDADLRPISAEPADSMIRASLRWPEPLRRTGPADPEWLREWLARGVRFEVGAAQPGTGS